MSFFQTNRSDEEIEEDQIRDIEKMYETGEIIDYEKHSSSSKNKNSQEILNGNSNSKTNNDKLQEESLNSNVLSTGQKQNQTDQKIPIYKSPYLIQVQKLRDENPELTFQQWNTTLLEKRIKFNDKVTEYFPDISLLTDFELSIKTILNIEDITLPFMGIVFAVPSSLKTAFFELLRVLQYSYFTDKFTARAFVSHSAKISKDKLQEIDMLPMIRDKILLTPELSALFTGKDEDIKEQFGIITRVLDGKGLETNSGVHGKRGYTGNYMFTWLGAAVDIPYTVYKFLSTIGFKIYFLRLPRTEVSIDTLVEQLTSKKKFNEKMNEIEKLLIDYLIWFEICPIAIGQNSAAKIEWDSDKDDRDLIKIIAQLALLLAHIRGHVVVYKNSDYDDRIPVENNDDNNIKPHSSSESVVFSHTLPLIENPSRAAQQLYNLARGHALSYGRNYITIDDILIVIKVVLSTGSIERVVVLDLLIAYNGILTTSQITESLRISNNTAKRTMTEFKGLELVTMERTNNNNNASNSEYKITLNPKFKWFLSQEFSQLRDGFKPTNYKDDLDSKRKSYSTKKNDDSHDSAMTKIPPVLPQDDECSTSPSTSLPLPTIKEEIDTTTTNPNPITINNEDSHKGENRHSKNREGDNNIQSNSPSSLPSSAFTSLMPSQQFNNKKLFNNPLISEADLLTGNYDPEVINNIDRVHPNSDHWFCNNCTMRGDKWFMMKHHCKKM
jgi:hypothetical protein